MRTPESLGTTTGSARGVAVWREAARPTTLPASVAPVLVGTAAATTAAGDLSLPRIALAVVVALSLQVAVNFANDYFDGVGGVDTAARVGPRRLVAAGVVVPGAMKRATVMALGVAGVAGLALAGLAGWELLVVGAAAGLAAVGYSGGPKPYASAGLGEVFVFLFFGVVATTGSAYVQDESLALLPFVMSLSMGALATALLVVNNLRDIHTDTDAGKITLAVRIGESRTRRFYEVLVTLAFIVPTTRAAVGAPGPALWYLLPLLAVPVVWPALGIVRTTPIGSGLVAALAPTARGQLVFAVLLTVALALQP